MQSFCEDCETPPFSASQPFLPALDGFHRHGIRGSVCNAALIATPQAACAAQGPIRLTIVAQWAHSEWAPFGVGDYCQTE